MNALSRLSIRTLFYCLLVTTISQQVTAAPSTADGWKLLWQNQNVAARATFRAALKQNPADTDALRGLGLLAAQEDDSMGALQAWSRMIRQSPAHWSTLAYWATFVSLAEETGRYALLEQAAQDILKSRHTSSELRASARLVLADAADRAGSPAAAEKQWAALGFLRQWNVIGPFDNVSRSGFAKAWPPEQGLNFTQEATGRNNMRLRWHRLSLVMRNGQCLVGDSLSDGEAGVFYAVTAVQSPVEQTVALRFDPYAASKIFLNGTCVFADEKYHKSLALVADPYQIPVMLRPGWNTLLIKIACEKDGSPEFRLRLTRPDGSDLPALVTAPEKARSGKVEGTLAASAVEPVAVSLLRKLPSTPETLMLIGIGLQSVEDYEGAASAVRQALTLAPACGWLHWTLSGILSADSQSDEASAERELARKANSRLIEPVLDDLAEKSKALTTAERIHTLTALLAVNPASAATHWALYDVYGEAKLTGKAFQSARAAYNSAPGIAATLRYFEACTEYNQEKEAESILALGLRTYPLSDQLLLASGRRLEQRGQSDAAIAAYRKALLTTEYPTSCRRRIAALYRAEKRWNLALAACQLLRQMRPQDSTDCSSLADVYQEMGRKAEAVALYREAIRLKPSRVELRDKLQVVTGEKPVLDLVAATPVSPILALAKTLKPAGAPAVMLLDEGITVVYPDYATVSRLHQIIKVLDEAGVKHFATLSANRPTSTSSASSESARVLKANGKIETIDLSDDDSSVTFPSLAAGDVIDVVQRKEDYPTGGLGRHFWDDWYFDETNVPSRLSRFVLITPPDMELQFQTHGTVAEPTLSQIKGWCVREWKRTDIPALPLSVTGVPRRDRGSWIDISTFHGWDEIVRWYQDLSSPLCIPDSTIRAQAQELTRNATTETDKIRALVGYVARKIQYQSSPFRLSAYIPTEGKQVLREHYGDCKDKSALLVALLSAVNIPAEMVLLSGREHGITPYLPSPRFNHAITRIHTGQGELWVDATADKMEFGVLPYPDQQVPALVIAPGTTALTQSPSEPIERTMTKQTFTTKLEATGRLSGDYAVQVTGNMGWLLRSALANVSADQHDQALRGIAAQVLPNVEFESGRLLGLEDQDTPLRIEFRFHSDHYGTTAGNFLLARLPWDFKDSTTSLLSENKPESDLEIALSRGLELSEVQMELPAGFEAQDLKPEVKGECPYGMYHFTYRVEGSHLIAHCEQRNLAFRIPARDLKIYRDYLSALSAEGSRQLVLKKTDSAK